MCRLVCHSTRNTYKQTNCSKSILRQSITSTSRPTHYLGHFLLSLTLALVQVLSILEDLWCNILSSFWLVSMDRRSWDSSGIAGGLLDLILFIDGWREWSLGGILSAELIEDRAWECNVVLLVCVWDGNLIFLIILHRFHIFIISPRTSPFRKQNRIATIKPCGKVRICWKLSRNNGQCESMPNQVFESSLWRSHSFIWISGWEFSKRDTEDIADWETYICKEWRTMSDQRVWISNSLVRQDLLQVFCIFVFCIVGVVPT